MCLSQVPWHHVQMFTMYTMNSKQSRSTPVFILLIVYECTILLCLHSLEWNNTNFHFLLCLNNEQWAIQIFQEYIYRICMQKWKQESKKKTNMLGQRTIALHYQHFCYSFKYSEAFLLPLNLIFVNVQPIQIESYIEIILGALVYIGNHCLYTEDIQIIWLLEKIYSSLHK